MLKKKSYLYSISVGAFQNNVKARKQMTFDFRKLEKCHFLSSTVFFPILFYATLYNRPMGTIRCVIWTVCELQSLFEASKSRHCEFRRWHHVLIEFWPNYRNGRSKDAPTHHIESERSRARYQSSHEQESWADLRKKSGRVQKVCAFRSKMGSRSTTVPTKWGSGANNKISYSNVYKSNDGTAGVVLWPAALTPRVVIVVGGIAPWS